MGICVPDASVILKWVLPSRNEPFAGAAQALRDAFVAGDLELVVPTLWLFEVGNTLTRKYPQQADELLGTLYRKPNRRPSGGLSPYGLPCSTKRPSTTRPIMRLRYCETGFS